MPTTKRQVWRYGLISGVVSASSASFEITIGIMIAAPQEFNFHENIGKTLLTGMALGILQGVKFACAYLKQSPLPPLEDEAPKT